MAPGDTTVGRTPYCVSISIPKHLKDAGLWNPDILPPDVSYEKQRLSGAWAYVFRHREGELA